jgi:hypothetical protein
MGRVLLLLALLALLLVQVPRASLNIVWRFAVLSFDNPATQVLDELACATTPYADSTAEARESVAVAAPGRLVWLQEPRAGQRPALVAGITRSPPAA